MTRRPEASDHYQSMTEAQLKRLIVERALRLGWAVHETPQVKPRRPVKGQSNGYPDLTLARDGEAMWIEVKDQVGVLSPSQVMWRAILPACHVIRPSDVNGRLVELLA